MFRHRVLPNGDPVNEEELAAELGFRVVERPGPNAWAIEKLDDGGGTL